MKKVVRILLTNGARTVEIFWLKHMQNGVYFSTPLGPPGYHSSYHSDGRRHMKILGETQKNGEPCAPRGVERTLYSYVGRLPLFFGSFRFTFNLQRSEKDRHPCRIGYARDAKESDHKPSP